jgi:glucose-1-phosphate cytidylyltransferase
VSDIGPKTDVDVPVIILAGGLGTRLREETVVRPKPMVEVGGRLIVWHIMETYDNFGYRRFILPVGYLGVIKAYVLSYGDRHADVTVHALGPPSSARQPARVLGCDRDRHRTRHNDRRTHPAAGPQPSGGFMVTYADGVADIAIDRLLTFLEAHGRIATVTAVQPASRSGARPRRRPSRGVLRETGS